MDAKIDIWIKEIQLLSEIGKFEPQFALSCFISGCKHKLNYYMRTIPNIARLLKRLDDVITKEFITAITGGIKCSDVERKLLSLPPKWVVLEYQYSQIFQILNIQFKINH